MRRRRLDRGRSVAASGRVDRRRWCCGYRRWGQLRKELDLTTSLDARFTKPLYSVTEAAAYVGVPRSTFDTWARGYERGSSGRRPVHGEPLLTTAAKSGLTIPFVGLAEAMALAAFRETGLSLQRIHPALDRLRDEHELHHALASRQLYTDGANVLSDYLGT